jgi:hypothetical protein
MTKPHLTFGFALLIAGACDESVNLGGRTDGGDLLDGSNNGVGPDSGGGEGHAGKPDAGEESVPGSGDGSVLAVCTPGQHHTCNEDIAMSGLAGTCTPEGTCRCNSGYTESASGKCIGGIDGSPDAGTSCENALTTEACVTCCKLPPPATFGAFELAGYDLCLDCPACGGTGPCGGNGSPPAGKACVECLQAGIAERGIPDPCATSADCNAVATCVNACPLR